LSNTLGELTSQFSDLFSPSGIVKAADIIGAIADDIWSGTIDAICSILQKMLTYMGDMVDALQKYGDAK
jgi:hypothetical protein